MKIYFHYTKFFVLGILIVMFMAGCYPNCPPRGARTYTCFVHNYRTQNTYWYTSYDRNCAIHQAQIMCYTANGLYGGRCQFTHCK